MEPDINTDARGIVEDKLRLAELAAHSGSLMAIVTTLLVVSVVPGAETNPVSAAIIAEIGLMGWAVGTPVGVAVIFAILRWGRRRTPPEDRVQARHFGVLPVVGLSLDALGNIYAIGTHAVSWSVHWETLFLEAGAVALMAVVLVVRPDPRVLAVELLSAGRGVSDRLSKRELSAARSCVLVTIIVLAAVSGAVTFGPVPGVDRAVSASSTDTFEDGSGDGWDAGSISNDSYAGSYSLSVGDSFSTWTGGPTISENSGDTATYLYKASDAGDWYINVITGTNYVRLKDNDATQSVYFASYSSNSTTFSEPAMTNGNWVKVKVKLGSGGTNYVKIWDADKDEPSSWDASYDTTSDYSGQTAIKANFNNAPVYLDEVAVNTILPVDDGVEVNGTITDGGSGINGGTVDLLNSSGTVVKSTTSNSTGYYSFSTVSDDDYTVRASASGYQNASKDINVSGSPKTVDLELSGSTLFRTVNKSADPVSNYSLDVYESDIKVLEVNTNSSGFARVALSDSTYDIEGSKDGYLAVQDRFTVSGSTSRTFEVSESSGEFGELVYNPNDLISVDIVRNGNVSSYSRNLSDSDVVVSGVEFEPDDPVTFTGYEYENGSTFLDSTLLVDNSSAVTIYASGIDYSNRQYIAGYRNGSVEQTFYPVDWLENGTFNWYTNLAGGANRIEIRGPILGDSGSPTCENVTVYTNDEGQVTGVSDSEQFHTCIENGGIGGGEISVAGANYTVSDSNISGNSTTTYTLEGGNTTNISSPNVSTRISSDRVVIPRPENGSTVQASVGGELLEFHSDNVTSNGVEILNWTGGTHDIGENSNVTANSTHAILRGDVVLLPGGTPVEPVGNFTSRPQTYYEDVRTRVEGPGIIDKYIDPISDASQVSGVSVNSFGGAMEVTIESVDRSVASTYGEKVVIMEVHSVSGYSPEIVVDGLVSGQSYAIYRDGNIEGEKTPDDRTVTFDVEGSGTYTVIVGKQESSAGTGDTPVAGGSGGGSPFPVWVLALVSLVGIGGAAIWYQYGKNEEPTQRNA